jgi:peroxiredoxin
MMTLFFRLAVIMLSVIAATTTITSADLPDGVKVGDKAPDFVLENIDGKKAALASFERAKGVILVFTCNHCPYSKMYEDRIIALHKTYAPKGWPVVAINPNDPTIEPEDSFEKMKERAKEKEFPFPYLFDATQKTALAYGARRTPHVFLLKNGKAGFTVEYIGAIDDNARDAKAVETRFVEKAVEALLEGKTPELTTTKAIGCTIKWRNE